MTPQPAWESLVLEAMADLAAAITTSSLYGADHPNTGEIVTRLRVRLEQLFGVDPSFAFVLIGDDLFVQGRPFTRSSRQAPTLIRRFRRRSVEHITFRPGIEESELRSLLSDLAATDDSSVANQDHIEVGKIQLAERELGGPDVTASGRGQSRLTTVRDRVEAIHDVFEACAAGEAVAVGALAKIVDMLLGCLEIDPDPLHHLAGWSGEDRWAAVHGHNVSALAMGMARLAHVGDTYCPDIGLAGMVHDVGKLRLPAEVRSRELSLSGDELELMLDHPKLGFELLLGVTGVPAAALIAVLEHHLAYNGSGYPRLPRPRRPHPVARLVAAVDAIDVLFTARGGRGLSSREAALAWILEHEGNVLDPGWGKALREVVQRSENPS
jgi:HD-GYP domain-containing protein (c-di-GMP phosphodiesterase class II)